jgi:hypothetical protein
MHGLTLHLWLLIPGLIGQVARRHPEAGIAALRKTQCRS